MQDLERDVSACAEEMMVEEDALTLPCKVKYGVRKVRREHLVRLVCSSKLEASALLKEC